jgi:hypothetical protein
MSFLALSSIPLAAQPDFGWRISPGNRHSG